MSAPCDLRRHIRELVALYRRTHYDVALPDGRTLTLHVGAPPPREVADWIGADSAAAYLTASNPRSRSLPDAENAERMIRLRHDLHGAGARWLEGCGHLPGGRWREPSLLVAGLALAAVDRFARDCEQDACLHVAIAKPVVLRLYRDDWRGHLAPAADLEWSNLALSG